MNNDKKVIVLNEQDTKLLREELEDFIVQANMLLNNKNFKNVEAVLKAAVQIVQKISKIEEKLDKFDEDFADMVLALQGVIKRLQESANVADILKEQHLQLKKDIEQIVDSLLLTLKTNLKQQILPYTKRAVQEFKKEVKKELSEFTEEIDEAIERARKRFGFFEKNEILEVLKEIDLRRKKANTAFYTAIFLFIASAVLSVVTYANTQKILKYTRYNSYILQQVTQQNQ